MNGTSIDSSLRRATDRLRKAGIDSPRREARLLLGQALRIDPDAIASASMALHPAALLACFDSAVARRAAREPMAYILGSREFWSLDFAVAPGVLVPRPESETLIEEALRRFSAREAPLRILDLGTGSGCLLLTFLSERRRATGVGVDISETALATACANAGALGLGDRSQFLRSDWAEGISGCFDVIFANPPYIATPEFQRLEPEVARYEPRLALDGGPDGLAAYRRIATALPALLAAGGAAFLEIGQDQAAGVERLMTEAKLPVEGTVCDLAGIPRCTIVRSCRLV